MSDEQRIEMAQVLATQRALEKVGVLHAQAVARAEYLQIKMDEAEAGFSKTMDFLAEELEGRGITLEDLFSESDQSHPDDPDSTDGPELVSVPAGEDT